ncbi:MAG: cytochrome c-type biogenesis protein CcmH [Rhodospirillaceae bacterium]|nr:cytochrome c-type biogenesis protein CcmH [Rhodospirillaceae bacterium]
MKKLFLAFTVLFVALSFNGQAGAVEPDEILSDPALEQRARAVSKQLRCVVCQNQSIDESNAELAHDMRLLVRDRMLAGDSNKDVLDYMVNRYGDYVLLEPPLKASTALLWYGPFILIILGLLAVVFYYRKQSQSVLRPGSEAGAELTSEERAKLQSVLSDNSTDSGKKQ